MASLIKPVFSRELLARPLTYSVRRPIAPSFKNPLAAKASMWTWMALWLLVIYLGACAGMLYGWAKPEIEHNTDIRLGADSVTYYDIAKAVEAGDNIALLTVGQNFIGPVTLAILLNDPVYVALFNLSLFLIILWVGSTLKNVQFSTFAILLMLNAEDDGSHNHSKQRNTGNVWLSHGGQMDRARK
jgi:hypothetical protein